MDRIGGQKDKLIGLVQEKYGYARDHAEQEVKRRFKEYGDQTGGAVANMTAKAQELGATTANKANEAATVVGEKIAGERDPGKCFARRRGGRSSNNSSGWSGIGKLLLAREKI